MPTKGFLYQVLYTDLRREILSGERAQGSKLPSEQELAAHYSVSPITVKKALGMLQEEGLVQRRQGQGTFVCALNDLADDPAEHNSRQIGLVLEHVASPFGLEMVYRLVELLDERGYKLCIRFTFCSIEKETEAINDLMSMKVAGLIIMPCHNSQYSMTILKLIIDHFPVVLVDKRMHGLPVNTVCTDGFEAMRQLVRHLKERGCKNAMLMTIDPEGTSSLGDRANGFRKGLEDTGLTLFDECILPRRTGDMVSPLPEEQYVSAIGEYLDGLTALPDGIVCTEYAIARALYVAAQARNIKIGQDVRVCCIDEDPAGTRGYFFTHMHQDERRLAEETVQTLFSLLGGKWTRQKDVRVPAVFHQGESS